MGQAIRVSTFLGMSPRTAERQLPDGGAVDATNLVITSGEIRPIRQPALAHEPAGSGPWLAVYRAEDDGVVEWLAWTVDVDVARVPLATDVEPRYCWTGDNEPRFAQFSGLPSTFYTLGVPAPQAAPSVGHSGGTGSAVSRIYCYTFFSALGEESAPSPVSGLTAGKVDGTWAITAMDAFPVSSGTVSGSHSSGVTTFVMAASANHWLRVGEGVTISSVDMLVTEVTNAYTFKVAGNYAAATSWARVAPWNTTSMKRRLYRSAGTNATFQLVHDDVSTTYNDTLTDAQIMGDELISQDWSLPPVGLRGMLALPNGAMSGFVGNLLCFSEPYQAHAWPTAYQFGTDFEIIGTGAYGNTVVAATAGAPAYSTGSEPASVTMEKVNATWPCLSKRSVFSVGDGVGFATADGLAFVGASGASIMTQPMFSKVEWAPLDPSSMIAAAAEGKIFVRWSGPDGTSGIMVFAGGESIGLTLLSAVPDELYADARNGKLYFVDSDGISQFDAGYGDRLAYQWRSKEFVLPAPVNMGAARVDLVSEQSEADYEAALAAYEAAVAAQAALVTGYKGGGSFGGAAMNTYAVNGSNIRPLDDTSEPTSLGVTFTLYYNGQQAFSRFLRASETFRLPAGKKSDVIALGLNGTVRVKSVAVAETATGLKQVGPSERFRRCRWRAIRVTSSTRP